MRENTKEEREKAREKARETEREREKYGKRSMGMKSEWMEVRRDTKVKQIRAMAVV
jgi:hypothetical protein